MEIIILTLFFIGVMLGEVAIEMSGRKLSWKWNLIIFIVFGVFGWFLLSCGIVVLPFVYAWKWLSSLSSTEERNFAAYNVNEK